MELPGQSRWLNYNDKIVKIYNNNFPTKDIVLVLVILFLVLSLTLSLIFYSLKRNRYFKSDQKNNNKESSSHFIKDKKLLPSSLHLKLKART